MNVNNLCAVCMLWHQKENRCEMVHKMCIWNDRVGQLKRFGIDKILCVCVRWASVCVLNLLTKLIPIQLKWSELWHCHCGSVITAVRPRIRLRSRCCVRTPMKSLIKVNFQFILYTTMERTHGTKKKTPSIYLIKLLTLESHAIQP